MVLDEMELGMVRVKARIALQLLAWAVETLVIPTNSGGRPSLEQRF